MWQAQDTIAQIATAPGNGIGVVRVSGPMAHTIGQRLIGRAAPTPRVLTWAEAKGDDGGVIDSGLYVEFVAPHSFTGEAVAEFQAHGSAVGLAQILGRCVALGARPAAAGEFSWRALRNGKMDLAQLEALAAAVAAESDAAFRLAQRQAQGELSQAVNAIRSPLLDAATSLMAEVEFPDEDLSSMDRDRVTARLNESAAAITALLSGFAAARRLSEGATIALLGPPNAGKSSVLNALVGYDRAIVSPVAGTTRDTVEATFLLGNIVCRVVDTAGLREAANDIEAEGMGRSQQAARTADVVLWLQSPDVEMLHSPWLPKDERVLRVLNKGDLATASPALTDWVGGSGLVVSARTGAGLAELRLALQERLLPSAGAAPGLVSQERHAQLLRDAEQALQRAVRAMTAGLPCELVLVDVNISIHRLGEMLGENVSEDVLAQIFKRFCIGK